MVCDVLASARKNDAVGLSAEIAFYGIFSLFPFVIVVRSLEPYLPEGRQLIPAILNMIQELSAGEDSRFYTIVQEQILQPADSRRVGVLSFGLLAALWASSRGFAIMVKGVNRAYGVKKERGWLARRLMGLAITVALLILLIGGMLVGVFGIQFLNPALRSLGLGFVPETVLGLLRWPLTLLLLGAGLALIYQVAPAERPRWRWTPPGSVFAVLSLLGLSFLMSVMLQQDFFSISWLTYSAFGVLLVVLLWMFLAGLVVLLGSEINAVLDQRQTRSDSEDGERPPAERSEEPASTR